MAELLAPLALIFVISAVLLVAAKRLSIPPVPVYIVVGLLVAPFIGRGQTLMFAEFGIAFLVFVFGVYVEPDRIAAVARDSEHVAAVQFLVVGTGVFGAGFLYGLDALDAVYLAIAAALSSSLVGRELLGEDVHLDLMYGRLTQSIHFIQDLFAVLLILLLSASAFEFNAIALKLGTGVILLVGALLLRVYLFELLVRLSRGSDELIALTGVALLVLFIAAAELLGVSIAVGAFAAGVAIKLDFEDNLPLLNALDSLEDFFVAIFFVTLGSLVTTPDVETALIAVILIGFVGLFKPFVTIISLVRLGYEVRTASLTSFSLDQVSEFALIIAIQALLLGRIDPTVFDAIVLAAAATMITSTATHQYRERLFEKLVGSLPFESAHRKTRERSSVDPDLADHVVVIGYGNLGRQITRTCERLGQPYVVVDHNPEQFDHARDVCDNVVFGDILANHTRELAHVESAPVIISTSVDRRVTEYILSLDEPADLFVRARTGAEASEFYAMGATYVVVPDRLASDKLQETLDALVSGTIAPDELRQSELRSLRDSAPNRR